MVIKEQKDIEQLVQQSSKILITTKENPGFDELASALAWRLAFLQQKKERVDVIASIPDIVKNRFKFLPGFEYLRDRIQSADRFIIRVDVSKTKVRELSYDVHGDALEVSIKPEGGNFSQKDVSFAESEFSYDCIIVIGAAELSALGPVFDENRELFFHTPVINIDRQSGNVRYGQINAVYLTTTSLAEISHSLVRHYLNKEIATCLLTGIIAATNSFQTPHVTPDTLQLASELIVAGASREEIVTKLYRTKTMDKLKLWGTVLTRLNQVDTRIVFSHLKKEDIGDGGVDLHELVEDLVLASPEAHLVFFFYEAGPRETTVSAYARENYDLPLLFQQYEPKGTHRQVAFTVPKDATAAELDVLEIARHQLRLINH